MKEADLEDGCNFQVGRSSFHKRMFLFWAKCRCRQADLQYLPADAGTRHHKKRLGFVIHNPNFFAKYASQLKVSMSPVQDKPVQRFLQ